MYRNDVLRIRDIIARLQSYLNLKTYLNIEKILHLMGYNTQEFKKEKKDDYVNKNFLLVSLEEKKAKKIAEVINNDTSRKIIDFLAKKDATESEL